MARNRTISNPPQRHIWRSPRHKARRRRRRLARLASFCLGLLVLLMAGWMLRPAISVALAALPEEIPVLLAQPQSRQKLLEVEYLGQGEYPTGCESVTAVMALRHAGYDITVTDFIDFYLPKGDFWVENGQAYGDDPNQCFVGDPYSSTGFGCYAPALEKALAEVAGQDAVENLTGASLEEITEAARKAHAHSFIMRMPEGYDTIITEGGGNLSQGQKQLLCIARIMLCLPPMLILDEATSSIDTMTEIRIQRAFEMLMRGRTSFVVAHRLSTIQTADVILVMNKGRIIEQGTHQELLAKQGFYADLYYSQFAADS